MTNKIEIIPAFNTQSDWMCQEYLGSEVFAIDENNNVIKTPLSKQSDLKVDTKIYVPTLVGSYIMFVKLDEDNKYYALTENGGTHANLEFDIDDRHCWTTSMAVNLKALIK